MMMMMMMMMMIRKAVTGVFTNGGFQPSAVNADSMQKNETKDALQHFCVKLNLPTIVAEKQREEQSRYNANCYSHKLCMVAPEGAPRVDSYKPESPRRPKAHWSPMMVFLSFS